LQNKRVEFLLKTGPTNSNENKEWTTKNGTTKLKDGPRMNGNKKTNGITNLNEETHHTR
jgi:hypothetical protein